MGGKGNGRVTVSMLCEKSVSLEKGRENSVRKVIRSNSMPRCSTIYLPTRFTTPLNLPKNLLSFIALARSNGPVVNNEAKRKRKKKKKKRVRSFHSIDDHLREKKGSLRGELWLLMDAISLLLSLSPIFNARRLSSRVYTPCVYRSPLSLSLSLLFVYLKPARQTR